MRATVTQIINVTAKHIADGERRKAGSCPIAWAIRDQVVGADDVRVGLIWANFGEYGADLPDVARDFVINFDAGHSVEPFAFALDVPVADE